MRSATNIREDDPKADAFVGKMIARYRVETRIAAGASGVVYQAADPILRRSVAIKALRGDARNHAAARERFIAEARAGAMLDHPNVGAVYDVGETEGAPFMVMPLYQGQTVREWLDAGPRGVGDAIDVVRQAALGLEAAHRAGVLHRDIKPKNLFRTSAGTVKILDFDRADPAMETAFWWRTVGMLRDALRVSAQARAAAAEMLYVSPEQLRGRPIDQRSDLWSVGILAYEMVAGAPPFAFDPTLMVDEDPGPLAAPAVPTWFSRLVAALLRRNVDERLGSAGELLARLEEGADAPATSRG